MMKPFAYLRIQIILTVNAKEPAGAPQVTQCTAVHLGKDFHRVKKAIANIRRESGDHLQNLMFILRMNVQSNIKFYAVNK